MERGESNFEWLLPDSRRLTAQAVAQGAVVECLVYRELDSTQDLLARMPVAELRSALAVVADFQSGGHGRRGRGWESAPGQGATFSLLVEVARAEAALLPMAAGLAALEAVRHWLPRAGLKWPNDLVVFERDQWWKLGGIVISLRPEGESLWAAIGIGINLDFAAAPRPTDQAAAIADFSPEPAGRDEVVARCLAGFQRLWRQPEELLDAYRAACVTLGQSVRVELSTEPAFVARAVDLASDGALVVESPAGRRVIAAADVVHLRAELA